MQERDIAKFFSLSSVAVRPEACALISQRLEQFHVTDQKNAYLELMLKRVKDRHQLLVHNSFALGNTSGQLILD